MGGKRVPLKLVGAVAAAVLVFGAILWQPLSYVLFGNPKIIRLSGQLIPSIQVEDSEGKSYSLAELAKRGAPTRPKGLFILWATWCEPCVRELPLVQENQARFASAGYELVLLNYDGVPKERTVPETQAWLIAQNVNLSTFFDFHSALINAWSIEALPFSFATGPDGAVTWLHMGYLDWNSLELP